MTVNNAAELQRPITLQRAVITKGSLNEEIEDWQPLGCVMAKRSYRSATEAIGAQQVQATMIARYEFRWALVIDDLNGKDRLRDDIDGRIYDIKGVYQIGRRKWIEVHASARAD